MLKDISKYKFYGRSQLVRLRGKYTVQTAHCAVAWFEWRHIREGLVETTSDKLAIQILDSSVFTDYL